MSGGREFNLWCELPSGPVGSRHDPEDSAAQYPGLASRPGAWWPPGRGGGEAVSGKFHNLQSDRTALGRLVRGLGLQSMRLIVDGKVPVTNTPASLESWLWQDAPPAPGHGRGGGGRKSGAQLLRLGPAEGDGAAVQLEERKGIQREKIVLSVPRTWVSFQMTDDTLYHFYGILTWRDCGHRELENTNWTRPIQQ